MKLLRKGYLTTCLTKYYNSFVNKVDNLVYDGHQQASVGSDTCDGCNTCATTGCWCYVERMDNQSLNELDVNMEVNMYSTQLNTIHFKGE